MKVIVLKIGYKIYYYKTHTLRSFWYKTRGENETKKVRMIARPGPYFNFLWIINAWESNIDVFLEIIAHLIQNPNIKY